MAEHPTPWKIQIVGKCGHVIDDLRDEVTAFAPADAAFWERIVKAVNNHDALVAALRKAIIFYDSLPGPHAEGEAALLDEIAATFDAVSTVQVTERSDG